MADLERNKKIAIGIGAVTAFGGLAYILTRKPQAKPATYTCPYCGKTFDSYYHLCVHIQEEHPGEVVPPQEEVETPAETRFNYTNLRCSSPWDPTGDHCILQVECDITNVGEVADTRQINLWLFLEEPFGWSIADSVELTLQPGETYHYQFSGGNYLPVAGYSNMMSIEVADDTCVAWDRTDAPCVGGDHSSICVCYMGYG